MLNRRCYISFLVYWEVWGTAFFMGEASIMWSYTEEGEADEEDKEKKEEKQDGEEKYMSKVRSTRPSCH